MIIAIAFEKDHQLMERVNFKTSYNMEKYNLNGACYDTTPKIEYPVLDIYMVKIIMLQMKHVIYLLVVKKDAKIAH